MQTEFGLQRKPIGAFMGSIEWAARQRARQYWQLDGFPRIVSGAFTVLLGAILALLQTRANWPLLFLVVFFLFEIQGGQKDVVEWLKARISYPRTGYVDALGETRPW